MVIVDRLNKMVKCIFMDGITTKNAVNVFYIHVWKDHGLLNFIIFDRGRPFVNQFWVILLILSCYDLIFRQGRFAGNVCQNLNLAVWANLGNVHAHWERLERWQRSRRVRRF